MSAKLPDGWTYFQSAPGSQEPSRWYATPPYSASVFALREKYGASRSSDPAWNLAHTVDAPTWTKLCAEAAEQVALHQSLMERES
ncbi:hypothetical protein ACFXAZ_17755 [Streptomyces sp. NPDC059477]|uniref:hypothetical protein n=1 Tax=Streptomyces sp. NPDC059477 TaxID=3346847 RepID=UPI003686223B